MDCSPPGSSVHGTLQAVEWSGLPFPSPGDLPDPGINHTSPILAGRFFTTEPPGNPSPQKSQHSLVFCLKCFFLVFNMEKLIYKTWLCLALDKPLPLLSFHFLIYRNRAWSIYLLISSHHCFLMDLCGSLCLISDAWLFFPKLNRPMSLLTTTHTEILHTLVWKGEIIWRREKFLKALFCSDSPFYTPLPKYLCFQNTNEILKFSLAF